jgi:hydroxymethylpyrimidine/phosphomethylpyrimidine kinase
MLDHCYSGVIGQTALNATESEPAEDVKARAGQDRKSSPQIVLTIAGFDPSSGAGITADLKVFAAHRLYGVSAITALTVQSTRGVKRTEPVRPEVLEETLLYLAEDVEIEGVKIGMLGTAENVAVVSSFLQGVRIPRDRIVLDPIIRSSSGRELLDAAGVKLLRTGLLRHVGWVTPNREELAILIGRPASSPNEVAGAAAACQKEFPGLNIVVTGGDSNPPNDFLRTAHGEEHWFPGERIETAATHGTGCTFSSALLANLLQSKTAASAVKAAKDYVREAIRAAYPIGQGKGPLHHLYKLEKER